jgi:acylphosphatase
MIARKYIVSGRVQGVGFRWFAKSQADKIGVLGFVRNLPNGDVEAFATGEKAQLAEFLAVLKVGPPASQVENTQQFDVESSFAHRDFRITY